MIETLTIQTVGRRTGAVAIFFLMCYNIHYEYLLS